MQHYRCASLEIQDDVYKCYYDSLIIVTSQMLEGGMEMPQAFDWIPSFTPEVWRKSQVVTIYKKGDSSDPNSYRPISLTSIFRKSMEYCLQPMIYQQTSFIDIAQGSFKPQLSAIAQGIKTQYQLEYTKDKVKNDFQKFSLIGLRPSGFSILTNNSIYKQFIRAKIEYGLCILNLYKKQLPALERIQDDCLRAIVGGHRTASMESFRVMTCLESMEIRKISLNAKYNIRLQYLQETSLIRKIADSNSRSSLVEKLKRKNQIYRQYKVDLSTASNNHEINCLKKTIKKYRITSIATSDRVMGYGHLHPIDSVLKSLPAAKPKTIAAKQLVLDYWKPKWHDLLNILLLVDEFNYHPPTQFEPEENIGELLYDWISS
ncbi:hypothetical protein BDF20DRAFT_990902 [Mycotypha africana]|uniref:uncharacterized protein n=1 Tax=Mycotypha africana TaxID=64632 RepID=UPI0023019AE3|nr:uncharacterized protein BDF20DRAFT_990902 [Mycotypha africana]KAI8969071.1 hypothetical protein BDF20DRAFT_990902 [Mycotypha africana]